VPPVGPVFGPQTAPQLASPAATLAPPPQPASLGSGFGGWLSHLTGADQPAATLAPPALPIGPGFGPLQITPPAFPSPYAAGGAATGGPGPDGKPAADGKLDIVITVPNLPPGGAVSATASGGAPQPVVDVGHVNPFGGF